MLDWLDLTAPAAGASFLCPPVPSAQPDSALAAFWRKGQRKWKVYRRSSGFSTGKKTKLSFCCCLWSLKSHAGSSWSFYWLGGVKHLCSLIPTTPLMPHNSSQLQHPQPHSNAPTTTQLLKSPKSPADSSWVRASCTQKCQVWDLGGTQATWLAPGYSLLMSSVSLQDLLTWAELWADQIVLEGSVPLADRPCLCLPVHSTSQQELNLRLKYTFRKEEA